MDEMQVVRDVLQNQERLCSEAYTRIIGAGDEFPGRREVALAMYKSNIGEVFEHAASPIEFMLINAFLASFSSGHPFRIFVLGQSGLSISELLDKRRMFYEGVIRVYEEWKLSGFKEKLFKDLVSIVGVPSDEVDYVQYLCLIHGFGNLMESLLCVPQANIDLTTGERIRVDFLILCPSIDAVRLVVECDGYDYHAPKNRFVSDRKRDRDLQSQGYATLRFSGSEIWRDPIKAAHELQAYLAKIIAAHYKGTLHV
jgi:very-short-patch-repair endonuclease